MTPRNTRIALIAAAFAAGLVLCFCVMLLVSQVMFTSNLPQTATIGGPFRLTDQNGRTVTEQDFKGAPFLVFFGFTHCPDVCPTTLFEVSEILRTLGPDAARVRVAFITVDPERDSPAQLASYLKSFHPRLVGLTGTPAEIEAVTKAYRVYVKKVADPKSGAGYTFDHSAIIYLMGPDGAYLAHFTHATSVDAMAERLAKLLH